MKYIITAFSVPALGYLSRGAFKDGEAVVGLILLGLLVVIFAMAVNDFNRKQ